MKKITFISQFPPPIHGLSKAVETLYNSTLSQEYKFQKVNITSNKKFGLTILKIVFMKADLFYFTISQTRGGNLRDLVILKLLKWKRARCLIHLHGGYYRKLIDSDCSPIQQQLNIAAMKHAKGAIVLGPSLVNIFEGLIDSKNIYTVPNCIDDIYSLTQGDFSHKKEEISNNISLNILYLSNFIESKGYKYVLELAKRAKDSNNTHLHFNFAGHFFNQVDKEFFFNFIKEHRLEEYITYHGVVTGKEKKELLYLCNVFILLTTYPNEGQPISILEAMGNGMAIITTDHAGIPDIVANERNGRVFPKNSININDVFTYLQRLDEDRELLGKIANDSHEDILLKYKEEHYINNMNTVFKKIINS